MKEQKKSWKKRGNNDKVLKDDMANFTAKELEMNIKCVNEKMSALETESTTDKINILRN